MNAFIEAAPAWMIVLLFVLFVGIAILLEIQDSSHFMCDRTKPSDSPGHGLDGEWQYTMSTRVTRVKPDGETLVIEQTETSALGRHR